MDSKFFEGEIQKNTDSKVSNVLSIENVYQLMINKVLIVKEVTQLQNNFIRNLLHKFHWDVEQVLEIIFQDEETFEEMFDKVPRNIRSCMDCEICCETMRNFKEIIIFDCNHRCCIECLHAYLITQISDGGLLNCICCPGFKCKYELDDDIVLQHLDERMKIKYKQIICNSFVQNTKMIKWCPSANCNNAIQIETGNLFDLSESVRCSCGNYFCFTCNKNSHDPLTCELIERWCKHHKGLLLDFQSEEWISKNTKACPKCKANIEKNGGCDHMTCKKCSHEFFWSCLCNYRGHHSCKNNDQQLAKSEMRTGKRHMFYWKKYDFMNNVYQMDINHYKNLMNYDKKLELREQWVKVDFVANAIEVLLESRRIIMHSYVFIYYMTTIGNEIHLLESLIEDFYQITEKLAYIVENITTSEHLYLIKVDTITKTVNCIQQRRKLLDYIKEGSTKNLWKELSIPFE